MRTASARRGSDRYGRGTKAAKARKRIGREGSRALDGAGTQRRYMGRAGALGSQRSGQVDDGAAELPVALGVGRRVKSDVGGVAVVAAGRRQTTVDRFAGDEAGGAAGVAAADRKSVV